MNGIAVIHPIVVDYKRWERHVDTLRWDAKFYSSLTWAKKQYSSLQLPLPHQDAKQWIIDNQRRIGWVYNSDETVTYYVIRTFVFGVYLNNPYCAMTLPFTISLYTDFMIVIFICVMM